MSSDQITYVLIALIVTGIAILLLLVGALVARRGRSAAPAPLPAALAAEPLGAAIHASEPAPAPGPDQVVSPPVAVAAAPPAPVAVGPAPIASEAPEAEPGGPREPPVVPERAAAPGEPASAMPVAEREPAVEETAVTPADLAAAARRVHDPREEEIIEGFLSISPRRREAAFTAPRRPSISAPFAITGSVEAEPQPGVIPPDPYVDEVTGLDSRAAWDRILAEENARYVRYRRPVGVVVAELDGLGRFEAQFGIAGGRRIMAAVGSAMRTNARRTDRVAHVGGGRFLVLLPETDEIQAINYVERVRSECERWLEAGAVALHVSMGWASPSAVGELDTALRAAEERMYAERRRAARAGAGDPDAAR